MGQRMAVMGGCRPLSGQIVNSFAQGKVHIYHKMPMALTTMFEQAHICLELRNRSP